MGFCEDFKKIILNVKQELVLIGGNTDLNAYTNTAANELMKITITNLIWKVPHISVADIERLNLLKFVERGTELDIAYRSWELQELPSVPKTTKNSWNIKTDSQLEKPRYVIFALQTARKNEIQKNVNIFCCSLNNVKLFLNSEQYPYDNLNLNFAKHYFATLYEMYSHFQESYYYQENEPLLKSHDFYKLAPIVVIDCSKQNDLLNTGTVDIRIEFETNNDIADKTYGYCLIIPDRIIKYNSLTGAIRSL